MKSLCRFVCLPICLAAALLAPTAARADGPPTPPAGDPIEARLIPPDLIIAHQAELALDDKQRDAIIGDMQKVQAQLVPLQWQMKAATDELTKLLDGARVDESKALAVADKMMTIERQFKRAQLGMLIRIRNVLTDAQRAKLAELRGGGARR